MKKTLLLHCCCGPCSSYVLTQLFEEYDVTILYYNPNIFPKEEYDLRHKELQKLAKIFNLPEIEINYDEGEFLKKVAGYELEKEGGARCGICFELRLGKTAEIAKKHNFDIWTTTLSVSPYKNAELLNKIGKQMEEKWGVEYLTSDFKKNDGYKKSIELSKQYGLYRQNYCGCRFSIRKNEEVSKKVI